ncbi:MAG: C25 family cysteine peptidase [Planctomycetota bacterium]|jgi:hypothetical protein
MRTLLVLPLLCIAALAGDKPLWVAVGSQPFVEDLKRLAAHRALQGFEVTVLTTTVEEALAKVPREPAYLLLVGDVSPAPEKEVWHRATRSQSLYRWRKVQPPSYASDATWGDRNGDGTPDFPVGRIPARTPEDLKRVVEKILVYEDRELGADDLRLVVWAGSPGYGGLIDSMATGMLVSTVGKHAPAWSDRWIISSDPKQALCGWPPDQPELFTLAMKEGSLLNAVLAHANAEAIFSMRHDSQGIWYRAEDARRHLSEGVPCAPLVLLACNCGEFNRSRPSLAEELLLLPGGPVATIGATTESHPLTNYYTGVCLLKALDGKYGPHARLGDLWLEVQRRAVVEQDPIMERILKDVEGKLEAEIDVDRLRRDQQLMYALLGDPAQKLTLPARLVAEITQKEGVWSWKAERPMGATRLEIGFQPAGRSNVSFNKLPQEKESSRALFKLANTMGGFTRFESRDDQQAWIGILRQKGTLRLVATGPGLLRVAVLEAK